MPCKQNSPTTVDAVAAPSRMPAGSSKKPLKVAFVIALCIFGAELVGGALTGSLALLIDAAHMLTDVVGLLIAVFAVSLAGRAPTTHRTWGFARAEVLAATLQAAFLLGVGLFVLVESIQRLVTSTDVPAGDLLVFGFIGLVGNAAAAFILVGGRRSSFNLRAAFLEVVNDALGSLGVIVAAVVIMLTGWFRADAVAAVLIGVLIMPRAFKLLRETLDVLLESTPRGLDLSSVREHMLRVDHVQAVHDLHVTQVASGLPVLTAHVTLDASCFVDGHAPDILDELQRCVLDHFEVSIEHSTFQLEPEIHQSHESTPHA